MMIAEGKLEPDEVLLMARDLLRGLADLHRLGIIVADLKPDNVLLDEGRAPVLCDFGISHAVSTTAGHFTATSTTGTFNYMAPEQFNCGSRVTPQCDMWALGATLLHLLDGRPPWFGCSMDHIFAKVVVQHAIPDIPASGLPPALLALLHACLRPEPDARPSARRALEAVVAGATGALSGQEPLQQQLQHQPHPFDYVEGEWTPLHRAAENGHVEAVQALLQAGANTDARDSTNQNSPLYLAAQNGHVEVVKALLQAGADKYTANKAWWTPLHKAAEWGHTEVVQALLEAGADKDVIDNNRSTPLHLAAEDGHNEAVQALLGAGADTRARDGASGRTPVHLAAQNGHVDAMQVLLGVGANKDTDENLLVDVVMMFMCCWCCGCCLHDNKVDDEGSVCTRRGNTPLHYAAESGHTEVLQVLLGAGADKDATKKDGWTPLYAAAQNRHVEAVAALLQAGANKEAATKDGTTPLHAATEKGHVEVVGALLQAGANKEAAQKVRPGGGGGHVVNGG
ncbi:hypothetical protein GPECTOR_372g153 [Gonium pectorale]|uniref:Protein kinase domain-containing protein n=1 Tax=Gonium pectorale TaxID=33097 RepID=A0A150FVF3_GONPE|nr:hypothetical protein GPECTOR_372g153 [Gonium pectorale]|eukprot:KXZ41601.1 hypothetical protein GPECTOR_372g153 [Gonium pectorale]